MFKEFLMVYYERDTESLKSDGIMGLSNDNYANIFDLAYRDGLLASPMFGFQLGLLELD